VGNKVHLNGLRCKTLEISVDERQGWMGAGIG
jgi:hypothetical protein